ncbi:MAG: NAD(P)-binding domain-containing protein [Chloroflexi bacterium]|uniref:NAD(P)-binding domain-containing protein n=1 Tax=Candidatus Chlorohelix allophototropha TaxID=3003348 RepID=A0A8T7M1S6_9CHLR|nr:NAD(P)-binding domain-containing protein [Chloroflexota bacterium]WJW65556.1 NAD(P)-binding domain-containing protein [Chloroflexota bacterium L227-S17]
MKIGIIGSGVVGQTLGEGFIKKGHAVLLGSREPNSEKLQEWTAKTGGKTGTFEEVAKFGELVVVAINWGGLEHALQLAGAQNLAGKVVIDATNPLNFGATGPSLAIGFSDSAGEIVQRQIPDAHVVKAFNIITAPVMIQADLLGEQLDMFIAGNDAAAKETVTGLLKDFGWSVVDLGGIEESRLLEPLAMIWIKYMVKTQNWQHGIKLVRK